MFVGNCSAPAPDPIYQQYDMIVAAFVMVRSGAHSPDSFTLV